MAAGNFDACMSRVFVYEGGKDDDPRDPGGRTNMGIIQTEYTAWLQKTGKWAVYKSHDVFDMTKEDAKQIYMENYWRRMRCEDLPAGVDLVMFDSGVNSGVAQAAKWAQRATGIVVDGDFGPATLKALQSANDNDLLCEGIMKRRLAMLQGLKTWKYYGKGWSSRVANVLKIAQAWATGSVGPDPVVVKPDGGNKKALAKDIAQPLIPVSVTSVASTAGTIGTSAGGAASQIQPVAAMFPDKIGAWILGAAGVLTIVAVVANQISTAAQKRADATKNAVHEAEVDLGADMASQVVAVNDNAPATLAPAKAA